MRIPANTYHWRDLTLPGQFLLAGAIVMLCAMFLVGNWISQRIQESVVQNSAATAALFMESFISPLSQELAETDTLSPPARQALAEIFEGTTLGNRVVSYKIWLKGGRIVHASDTALIGQQFPPSDELLRAWSGEVAASFEDLNDLENQAEAELGVPLLEVYSPVREVWTGEVIAVAEFYERADKLASDIDDARRSGWLIVGGTFLCSGFMLFWIVQAGGRTIRQQRQALTDQLRETEAVSKQNALLRKTAVAASSRATSQTERAIRRIGSDLHDGPAQYLSLASLRLDGAFANVKAGSKDVSLVRNSLEKALEELRIISRGLALPDLDGLNIPELIDRAVKDHRQQAGLIVHTKIPDNVDFSANYAQKLCVFRFLQEALSNVSRHSGAGSACVELQSDGRSLNVSVTDDGAGFDAAKSRPLRHDGGQGLYGLTDRAESIGGHLSIIAKPGAGTTISLSLPFEETTL